MEMIINAINESEFNLNIRNSITELETCELFPNGLKSKDQLDTYRQVLTNMGENNFDPQILNVDIDGNIISALYLGSHDNGFLTRNFFWYMNNGIEYMCETDNRNNTRCTFKVSDINADRVTFN